MKLPAVKNPFTYVFHHGGRSETVRYDEYLLRTDLQWMMNSDEWRHVVMGRQVILNSVKELEGDRSAMSLFMLRQQEMRKNWLHYFQPNSAEQLDFINDCEHDVTGVIAPNRVGKTTVACAKVFLNGAIPLDKSLPVFRDNGVVWKPYKGDVRTEPYKIGFATYQWQLMKNVLWPRVRALLPAHELGIYGPDFLKYGAKRRNEPQWQRNPRIELTCGTVIQFFVYEQDQQVYESDAFDEFVWDEQTKEHLFDAVDERTRTLRGRHIFSLTPHKVEGRPDTGGGGWIEHMFSGTKTKGHNVRMYPTSLMDVPDWVYPESEKKKAFRKWIEEPTLRRDIKTLREGKARVLGEWHRTSGLVLDEWEPKVHVCDDFEVPEHWTRYRAIDHGITNPTVCLWLAVSPPEPDWGSWIVVYREYYSLGKTIGENCAAIIKASGNLRRRMHQFNDVRSGNVTVVWEEMQEKEKYAKTVLDSRSFASDSPDSGRTNGQIYRHAGLHVQPASGKKSEHWVPILKEMLNVDWDRMPYRSNGHAAQEKGASRLMIFRSCLNLRREIEGWAWEPMKTMDNRNLKEAPRKKDDHGCNALGYAAQIPLRWRGDVYAVQPDRERDDGSAAGGGDEFETKGERDDGQYRSV